MGRAFEYRRAAKEKRWDKMSKVFPKLARAITVAAREGGTDPEMNPRLRLAIQNAKAENMPKDNIESAIQRAEGKDSDEIKTVTYEGKGPHGVMIVVECATDNTNRSVANVKALFNKTGGQVLPNGSLDFMFDRKTVVTFDVTDDLDMEETELALIDAGLEELEIHEETAYAYGDATDFGNLTSAFDELGIETKKAGLRRIASNPQEFTEEQMSDIEELLDKLEEDEDVQAVYTNVS